MKTTFFECLLLVVEEPILHLKNTALGGGHLPIGGGGRRCCGTVGPLCQALGALILCCFRASPYITIAMLICYEIDIFAGGV
jgi:hypothetical protein